jgi:hypothetical protein
MSGEGIEVVMEVFVIIQSLLVGFDVEMQFIGEVDGEDGTL